MALMHYTDVAGRGMLTTHLQSRKVLVVIDDTDDAIQLKYLLPQCELHPESLVIITTCKRDALDARRISVNEVQLMPKGRDLQLFKAWAFAAGTPAWDTSVLVPEVVACCRRLPLTLKVGNYYACRSLASALQAIQRHGSENVGVRRSWAPI